jgi:hypothetical protein
MTAGGCDESGFTLHSIVAMLNFQSVSSPRQACRRYIDAEGRGFAGDAIHPLLRVGLLRCKDRDGSEDATRDAVSLYHHVIIHLARARRTPLRAGEGAV